MKTPAENTLSQNASPCILVVEDDARLSRSICAKIESSGFSTEAARTFADASQKIAHGHYHLIILDITLPDGSGLELLRLLRSEDRQLPVLILSAYDSPRDKVRGFNQGADDYLAKPFDSGELVVRIQALLRRTTSSNFTELRIKDMVINLLEHTVTRGGQKIVLRPREFALLEFLVRNKNQILTRARIAEQVWGYTFDTGTNVVDVYISYLRKAIEKPGSDKLIRTVHGEGFILVDD